MVSLPDLIALLAASWLLASPCVPLCVFLLCADVIASEDDTKCYVKSMDAVSVKLPPYYQEDAQGWFLQAEAQFGI